MYGGSGLLLNGEFLVFPFLVFPFLVVLPLVSWGLRRDGRRGGA